MQHDDLKAPKPVQPNQVPTFSERLGIFASNLFTLNNFSVAFLVLTVLQMFMAVVAFFTSSGYEDSAVSYVVMFVVALLQFVLLGIVATILYRASVRRAKLTEKK